MVRIAINGYGRIGRNVLRALYESNYRDRIEIVAINDLGDPKTHAHLTQYDSTHGRFFKSVEALEGALQIGSDRIEVYCQRDPAKLSWKGVDVVLECSGHFASKDKAQIHLQTGAKKVLISAPAGNDLPTIVYGVNHQSLTPEDTIVSNASCTTNCLAPLVKPLHEAIGIDNGLMTTIHAFTNDQVLSDVYHSDLRRARAATESMIPTKTGAAAAVGLVLPELKGKLDGLAVRVPVLNVSLVDLSFVAKRDTSVEEVNTLLVEAAQGALQGILAINQAPLVSKDFNHHPASSIFDATQTRVSGRLVKLLAWYDNEWGFSNRMLDTALVLANR